MSKKTNRRRDYWDDPKAPRPTTRKASASALVKDQQGRILLLQRPDNGLWTIPTGAVKKNETVTEAAVRECREETGVDVAVTGLVGVFSDPRHIVAYADGEVRQPINVCLHARPVGGQPRTTKEASAVEWVPTEAVPGYNIHPAIRRRIEHGLSSAEPRVE